MGTPPAPNAVAYRAPAGIAGGREHRLKGIVCSVKVELTIGERTAPVTISWHYAGEEAAPRLVTAYITL